MSTPSSPKTFSLSARLQADQEQIQRQLAGQSQQLLTQHAASSTKLFSDALRSIRSVSERQCAEIDALHQQTLTRIRWLLLWPIAATVSMSLLMLGGVAIWTTYRLDQIDQAQAALEQMSANLSAQQQAAQQAPQPQVLQLPQHRKRR